MKKKNIILVIILIAVLLFALFFGIKIMENRKVLADMEKAISNLIESKNFSYEVSCSDKTVQNFKKLVLGNKVSVQSENGIWYSNAENNELYIVNTENNTYTKLDASNFPHLESKAFANLPTVFATLLSKINNSENDYMKILLTMKVSNVTYNNVECYKISLYGKENTFISKSTLLPIKYVFLEEPQVEYEYKFTKGTVQETDVTFNNVDNFMKSE